MSRLLIHTSHLYTSFGAHSLLQDISLSVHEGDSFAFIGENGSGKSTLLSLLAGLKIPDSGEIKRTECLTIGLLPQEVSINDSDATARTYLTEGALSSLGKEMMKYLDEGRLEEWATLHEEYERKGGYRKLPLEKLVQGLRLELCLDTPMDTLSSGQRVRVALAKALIENPDLLLLDEPTNHLDQEMMKWLCEVILSRKGATILVSHDREFLNKACNRLIELKGGTLTCYGGSYDYYLDEKERLLEKDIEDFERNEEKKAQIREKIKAMTFSRKKPAPPSDRNTMAYDAHGEHHQKSLSRTLNTLKEQLEALEEKGGSNPRPKSIKGLHFSSDTLSSYVAIEIENISKTFQEQTLFENINLCLGRGDRTILKGPNGSGKTTLLRCIIGEEKIDSGIIKIASGVHIGYLDQEVTLLPMNETPLLYFEKNFRLSEHEVRSELHKAALLGADLLNRPFSTLSVGQRKRMMLLSLILSKPNVLLLDEPTNHLDLMTLEAFEQSLLNFHGAILAVSHDARFIEKIGTNEFTLVNVHYSSTSLPK